MREALTWFSSGVENFAGSRLMYAVRTRCHLVTNGDEKRSSSLAGIFSFALDSFSDLQNFLHAFKSLLVLYLILSAFRFLRLQKLPNFDFIFARSFLGWLKFANAYSFSLPFSIINRNKPIFFLFLFVCL